MIRGVTRRTAQGKHSEQTDVSTSQSINRRKPRQTACFTTHAIEPCCRRGDRPRLPLVLSAWWIRSAVLLCESPARPAHPASGHYAEPFFPDSEVPGRCQRSGGARRTATEVTPPLLFQPTDRCSSSADRASPDPSFRLFSGVSRRRRSRSLLGPGYAAMTNKIPFQRS